MYLKGNECDITQVYCKYLWNWRVLKALYEFPDDDSLGVETCSNVMCHSLNSYVGCVSFWFFGQHCNTTGRLRISMGSDLIGNVTDDACGRIRADNLEAVKLIALVVA
jgi:hypothetical protein